MKYEEIVYRCPGPHSRPGGTFECKGVRSEEEHAQATKDGWFNTLPEAIDGKRAERASNFEPPPSREELEHKAKELGIKFDKKATDESLSKKIADALGA